MPCLPPIRLSAIGDTGLPVCAKSLIFKDIFMSLNGDIGASVPAAAAHARIAAARSGDVIISHINQPKRAAGAGVIAGILALKARGFSFVHLNDVTITTIA